MASRMTLTAAFLAAAVNLATAEISGHYRMDGVDTKGVTYAGTADISMSSESNCRIMYSDGFEGICMAKGTTFAVSYIVHGKLGLALYEIGSDGTLQGAFIDDFHGGSVGRETLIPAR